MNAEDVDAVVRVGRLALEYRYTWKGDVVVDLIGYRRHGHSEVDDPTVTQPLLYKAIKDHPPLWEIYAEDIGVEDIQERMTKVREELEAAQKKAKSIRKKPLLRELPSYWNDYKGGRYKPEYEVDTGLSAEELSEITARLTTYPSDFHIHPKVKKLLEQRAEMGAGKRLVDYGMAEALALGGLVKAGVPVRLTGQDTRRGTFNQRHSVLLDIENEQEYVPLENIAEGQARCQIYNSSLSEAGVLGFEYGYSRDYPETLVMWEAQFGDFANVAQAVIDQFVSAGEDKWGLLSGVVLLLPHGHEGQGPEHSSARRNAFCNWRPAIIFRSASPRMQRNIFTCCAARPCATGASRWSCLLRRACCAIPTRRLRLADFTHQRFLTVLPETEVSDATRILICTGKIGHELRAERKKRNDQATAIVSVEQLYPFPEKELEAAIGQFPSAREVVWVQEEPANMGALFYVLPRLRRIAGDRAVLSVKRSASASPATGSAKAHEVEQKTLLTLAFPNKT